MIGGLSEATSPLLFCAILFLGMWVQWRSFEFHGFLAASHDRFIASIGPYTKKTIWRPLDLDAPPSSADAARCGEKEAEVRCHNKFSLVSGTELSLRVDGNEDER
jgi:hypothetical protein